MAIYVTTALGRSVPQHEWGTILDDLILKVLYDFRMSPFNKSNAPLTLTQLANAAGVSPNDASAHAESLAADGLVEVIRLGEEPAYKITGKGVTFVRNTPQGLASVF